MDWMLAYMELHALVTTMKEAEARSIAAEAGRDWNQFIYSCRYVPRSTHHRHALPRCVRHTPPLLMQVETGISVYTVADRYQDQHNVDMPYVRV